VEAVSVETIGSGIKTALATVTDIVRVFAPGEIPDSIPETPCAIILPGEIEYDQTFTNRATTIYHFRILILITKQDQPSAINRMLDYTDNTGADSIRAALYTDKTLNSSCDDCRLERNTGPGWTEWGGTRYMSTEFELWAIK